jgi:hypothetical protein
MGRQVVTEQDILELSEAGRPSGMAGVSYIYEATQIADLSTSLGHEQGQHPVCASKARSTVSRLDNTPAAALDLYYLPVFVA